MNHSLTLTIDCWTKIIWVLQKPLKSISYKSPTPRRHNQPKSFSNFLIKTMYPKPYLPAYFLIQILIFCLNKNSTLFVLSVQIDKGKQQTISLRVVHELIVIWYIFTCRVNYCYRLTFTRLWKIVVKEIDAEYITLTHLSKPNVKCLWVKTPCLNRRHCAKVVARWPVCP